MRKHQLWVDAGRHERQLMGTSGLSYRRIKSAVRRQTANSLKPTDRKSTRLNSSHVRISYAVFCLKKKNAEAARINSLATTRPCTYTLIYALRHCDEIE